VHVKIHEAERERIQQFQGAIIKLQGGGITSCFTVRRISHGVGVERTFFTHSPILQKVEVIRHGDVARAKLYYALGRRILATRGTRIAWPYDLTPEEAELGPRAMWQKYMMAALDQLGDPTRPNWPAEPCGARSTMA
jgi:large subunit ribosomal protein L19